MALVCFVKEEDVAEAMNRLAAFRASPGFAFVFFWPLLEGSFIRGYSCYLFWRCFWPIQVYFLNKLWFPFQEALNLASVAVFKT